MLNSYQIYLIDELVQSTEKKEELQEERFSKSVLQKIENDYHSKSIDKSQAVQSLLEVFGQMVFENVFLSWFSKKINATKNGCLAVLQIYQAD